MGAVKQFRISASLREKARDLLTRYDPSDLSYTIAAALYDRYNKLTVDYSQAHSKEKAQEIKRKRDYYMKAAKRFITTAKSLKMLEMEYLQ
jgi:hypothetical protein